MAGKRVGMWVRVGEVGEVGEGGWGGWRGKDTGPFVLRTLDHVPAPWRHSGSGSGQVVRGVG
jgi:hypothetical protein